MPFLYRLWILCLVLLVPAAFYLGKESTRSHSDIVGNSDSQFYKEMAQAEPRRYVLDSVDLFRICQELEACNKDSMGYNSPHGTLIWGYQSGDFSLQVPYLPDSLNNRNTSGLYARFSSMAVKKAGVHFLEYDENKKDTILLLDTEIYFGGISIGQDTFYFPVEIREFATGKKHVDAEGNFSINFRLSEGNLYTEIRYAYDVTYPGEYWFDSPLQLHSRDMSNNNDGVHLINHRFFCGPVNPSIYNNQTVMLDETSLPVSDRECSSLRICLPYSHPAEQIPFQQETWKARRDSFYLFLFSND